MMQRLFLLPLALLALHGCGAAGLPQADDHGAEATENDFIPEDIPIEAGTALRASKPDPESLPQPGETQDDVDHRLGPWLKLKEGGVAIGAPQGKVVTNPDGTTTGAYGILQTGTLLAEKGEGFKRISRAPSSWGTGFMISLLENASAEISREYPGVVIGVGGIAKEFGGHFPPHKSHQNGLDADILFVGQTKWGSVLDENKQVTERFDYEKNWQFWRMLTSQRIAAGGKVDSIVSMILVAPEIKVALCKWAKDNDLLKDPLNLEVMRRVRPTEGHDDHFHIRLRCSPYHSECTWTYGAGKSTGCET